MFFNKKLCQYFLHDKNIAKKIVNSISFKESKTIVEIGPGMGILTQYLLLNNKNLFLLEIDKKYVEYLKIKYPIIKNNIFNKNFLIWNPKDFFLDSFTLIGNFPYKISSQILFNIIKYREYIPECIGMFQKEVADRITSKHMNKSYGKLSVIMQAFYKIEYLFTVNNTVFIPKPRVKSAVVRMLKRKDNLLIKEDIFIKIVKTAFLYRRKKLYNSLKKLSLSSEFYKNPLLKKRVEQLSVNDFILLTKYASF
ncbi:16S rRNA (adenine(1518)-N(6)/adenine(1519)-N(6))-dimethyltransferase RsmA [Candidatus Karelsulcia muelleri]|uniref:Ribosomal RNA small subunit methyltransferase A n=1 Tax=Candidatus Karelsulcia muelleri TaxID=336810 RepID=A0A3A1MMM3_9FLAO|nr:16S rRNA (adenine(1518)-N(6)/adenine(1519)-N(6))-dimethyltransferase RsmA [Candidatus Karelsulcia muelleri]RIU86559.1 16S rRNA (adenine(1518)-N(6)/adenine(1519)-N(6))-dimethyltransferase RsmA [Candidatus Karelsulcia muelleri]